MRRQCGYIAFTDDVRRVQEDYGSAEFYCSGWRESSEQTRTRPSFSSLSSAGYDVVREAGIVVSITAYDWNCPQHIPRRFTPDHVEQQLTPLRDRVRALEAQIAGSAMAAQE